jgi:hypothetical protein
MLKTLEKITVNNVISSKGFEPLFYILVALKEKWVKIKNAQMKTNICIKNKGLA